MAVLLRTAAEARTGRSAAGLRNLQEGSRLGQLPVHRMEHLCSENRLDIVVVALMVGGHLLLRTAGGELASTAELEAQRSAGTPTLPEFYAAT